ncbi:type II secretion system protein [Campylobacter sp. RM6883]|nr:type II secretion system protein [Campylobacter sp. RM6883]MBE2995368.1 type II secretion system protein [Campylobacter sp. RM6913]
MQLASKRAFTMIELVLVIVIAGILAALAMPRLKRDNLREAAEQIITHIRYAQHLALQDDKFKFDSKGDPQKEWYKKRWNLTFNNTSVTNCNIDKKNKSSWKYHIYHDIAKDGTGNLNSVSEAASNIIKNGHLLSAGWQGISKVACKKVDQSLNIGKRYGVTNVTLEGSCGRNRSQTISFDELGRPMRTVSTTNGGGSARGYDRLLKDSCRINLSDGSSTVSILVHQNTGYACILDPSTNQCKK